MINLDPQKIDQESLRKKRQKLFLKIALLPCTALLFGVWVFLKPLLFNVFYSANYNNENFESAIFDANMQQGVNWLEPYLSFYNRGVAELMNKDYEAAEADFKNSLDAAPPAERICHIGVNLALSIELQGDARGAEKNYQKAIIEYNRAEAALYGNNCLGAEGDEKALAAKTRLTEKRHKVVARMNKVEDESAIKITDEMASLSDDTLSKIREEQKDAAAIRDRIRARELED